MTRTLIVSMALMGLLASSAGADDSVPATGRGWIFGGGLTGGTMSFSGADGRAIAIGPVTEYVVVRGAGTVVPQRSAQLVDASLPPPPGTVVMAPLPNSSSGGGMTMHAGYALSPRIAVVADVELMAPWKDGFTSTLGAVVVRYRLARRLWVQAGPAQGDLGYSYEGSATVENSITGRGFVAGAGLSVLSKRNWTLDIQARYGSVGYDGVRARNVTFGLSAGRVRSGAKERSSTPESPAAARRDGTCRG